jgi:dTDP-4-amino-4,6-dideoxygalactose transaminase
MNYPFLNLGKVNAPFMEEMDTALSAVLRSGRYLLGHETSLLQEELAEICGATAAVAVSNGLDAIRLIFRAYIELGVLAEGDEVLVPANTYIASILPLTEMHLTPILIEPETQCLNMDWEKALAAVTDRTKAVLIVHLYGTPCWNRDIALKFREKGIKIIEDNAQAIGAHASQPGFNGTDITGNLGDAAAFSFYPTKNIGALGDAGAVVSCDTTLLQTIKALANYGSDRRYHNIYCGWNCRMDELQAAILRVKLRYLEQISEQRAAIAAAYDATLNNTHILKPAIVKELRQVWHQYVVRVKDRERFLAYLTEQGIGYDIHYPVPPHQQPCYTGKLGDSYPITEQLANEIVSLPIADITPDIATQIATILNRY